MRSVLFMLFNPVRDELITGGVGGTKVRLIFVYRKRETGIHPMKRADLCPRMFQGWVESCNH